MEPFYFVSARQGTRDPEPLAEACPKLYYSGPTVSPLYATFSCQDTENTVLRTHLLLFFLPTGPESNQVLLLLFTVLTHLLK